MIRVRGAQVMPGEVIEEGEVYAVEYEPGDDLHWVVSAQTGPVVSDTWRIFRDATPATDAVVAEKDAEIERLVRERREFTSRLGYGDGITEPAATLAEMVDPIEQAFSEASEYRDGPRICEPCGEWLADTVCEHCHGSGCGPGTASGAYSECEWCAGVGKVHPGCVEQSYTDLVRERDEARAAVERIVTRVRDVHPNIGAYRKAQSAIGDLDREHIDVLEVGRILSALRREVIDSYNAATKENS